MPLNSTGLWLAVTITPPPQPPSDAARSTATDSAQAQSSSPAGRTPVTPARRPHTDQASSGGCPVPPRRFPPRSAAAGTSRAPAPSDTRHPASAPRRPHRARRKPERSGGSANDHPHTGLYGAHPPRTPSGARHLVPRDGHTLLGTPCWERPVGHERPSLPTLPTHTWSPHDNCHRTGPTNPSPSATVPSRSPSARPAPAHP